MAAELFVSYSRSDTDAMLPWLEELRRAGVSVWLDKSEIRGALQWRQEIVEAIGECKVLLLMISTASMASPHVLKEVTLAAARSKPILPLYLEPAAIPTALQYDLEGIQHIELFHGAREEQRQAILRSLAVLGIVVDEGEEGTPTTDGSSPAVAPEAPASARHNLPRQLSSFIGREREIAETRGLLADASLVTLTGTGGTGKTRLALQLGTELLEEYPDGVWLVELAALQDPVLVPQTVASALGVREEPGRLVAETLQSFLRTRTLLLILDNCEHLTAACAGLVDALLRACPGVRVLATSREALGVPGEALFRVPSLATPDPRRVPPLESLLQYDAVRLFVDRARLSQSSFAVTEANAPAVAAICRRLDGIPLAIELAAARVKLLSVEQIMARLNDVFKLLTGGSRTALPRQQTLRALIDWSYDLLSEEERALFRRLSVFIGGFTLEAAAAVCAEAGIDEFEVMDRLGQLVDKSLVIIEGDEPRRYGQYLTIRQYGEEKLVASSEAPSVRAAHSEWCVDLAEQAEPELRGAAQREWLQRLESEHDNLRAAFAWSVETGETATGLRLAGALPWFWFVRGFPAEGREWLAKVLSLPGASDASPSAARAKALNGAGILARSQGDYAAAQAFHEECLAIARELGDRRWTAHSLSNMAILAQLRNVSAAAEALYQEGLAIWRELGEKRNVGYALHGLGMLAQSRGDHEAARGLFEESLTIKRELGDQWGIATSLQALGALAVVQRDYGAAEALLAESLAIGKALEDRRGIADALRNLGNVAYCQGDYATARARHEESLALRRELDDREGIAYSLCNLGRVICHLSDGADARAPLVESLTIFRALGHSSGIAEAFKGFAEMAIAQGQLERAARLLGAAERLRGTLESSGSAAGSADCSTDAAARTGLGDVAFVAARDAGRALSLEEAIAEALSEVTGA